MGTLPSCLRCGTRLKQKVFVYSQQRGFNKYAAAKNNPINVKLKRTIRRTICDFLPVAILLFDVAMGIGLEKSY